VKPGAAIAVAAAILGAVGDARATVPVALDLAGCADVAEAPVERLLAMELRAAAVPARDQVTRVSARCREDPDVAELEVVDPVTGKSLRRTVDLRAAGPAGRPRLLALSIIELLGASWTELEATGAPGADAPAAIGDETLSAVRARPGETRREVIVGPAALVHQHDGGVGLLAGAGARAVAAAGDGLRFSFALGYERGERAFDLGTVTTEVLSLGVGVGWQRARGPLALRLDAGVRGGAAQLQGQPRDGTVQADGFWTPWVGPAAGLAISVRPVRWLAVELAGDAGWAFAARPARIVGESSITLGGAWFGAALALAFAVGG
jgi:hypothetical protein